MYRRIAAAAAVVGIGAAIAGGSAQAVKSSGVSAQDENYLQTAAAGDSFEIKGGQLALQKSKNAQVRSLAQTLIKDHTKSLKETKALAKKLGVPKVQNKPTPSLPTLAKHLKLSNAARKAVGG